MKQKQTHNIIVIALVCMYTLALFKPMGAILHYAANYGLYVNELCENKDKPLLQCNGTCQLAKQLNLLDDKEAPALPVFEGLQWYIALFYSEEAKINTMAYVSFCGFIWQNGYSMLPIDIPTPPPIVVC